MKNKKITRKITQGVYVLTTQKGGCIVDAVSQVSAGEEPLIAVAVMKKNYTNELLKQGSRFALSILGENVKPEIIQTFGMNSMRYVDKFDMVETRMEEEVPIIPDSLGYMICDIVDSMENETHTLFIGKLIEGDIFHEEEPMSYGYYQKHKEKFVTVTSKQGKTAWICLTCGYVYYGDEIPEDFKCPICGMDRSYFKRQEN